MTKLKPINGKVLCEALSRRLKDNDRKEAAA